ncbi:MAG: DUF637 domain-containing protein [Rhodobacterales bacterium]
MPFHPNAVSSGLSSVVNGTSFKDGLKSSLVHDVVALGLADAQTKIGGIFSDAQGNPVNGGEGSFGHVALHAIAGCVAAQAQGADCAAGAAGGAVQAIYAGVLNKGTNLTGQQQQQRAKLYGAFVGYLFSGGKGENVSAAANIAISGIANNRLLHRNESVRLLEELGLLKNSEAAGLVADLSDADLDKLLYSPKFFKLLTSRQHRIVAASCVLVHCNLQTAIQPMVITILERASHLSA